MTSQSMNQYGKTPVLAIACLSALTFISVACSRQPQSVADSAGPDLVIINADVRTVDANNPRAQAFAVKDGKIIAVGSSDGIRALAGTDTVIIDAGQVTVIPGLIDGHTHLLTGSELAVGVDLSEIEDKSEWLRIVRDKADSMPDGAWILGGAWDHNLSDGVLPTKEMLDAVAPNNPVLLSDIDRHSVWANSLALELAGVTGDTAVPPGAEIMVNPISGEPTGIIKEARAALFNDAPGMAEAMDEEAGILAAAQLANSFGITTVHDMHSAISPGQLLQQADVFLSLIEDDSLTLRVWQGARVSKEFEGDAAKIYSMLAAQRHKAQQAVRDSASYRSSGPLFDMGYTKLVIDGVLSTYTAMLKAPYSDNPHAVAESFLSQNRLDELITAAHENGFPVAVHAIGDLGVAWVLDAFSRTSDSDDTLIDRIEHIEVVAPEDIQRFKSLGVAASMQPHHATCCVGNYVIDRIGRERLPNAYVWRSMLDNGVLLVLGSDWPTSPLNPMIQMADTLHRETRIDGVVRPWDEGNTLTFEEALYGYTQAGASVTAWADEIGSISVGKWADFVILDSKVPGDVGRALENVSVTATYLAGKKVFPR